MKQFVLWDVQRDELSPTDFQHTRLDRCSAELRTERPPLPRLRPECSAELDRFVPASRLAKRAHGGLRAALRLLLRQPLKLG
jgi:hypothetical protein